MKNTKEHVAVYGGTFNPPTLAHMQVIQEVLTKTQVTKIIMSPSWERSDKQFWIEDHHRKRMSQLCVDILTKKWYNVSLDTFFVDWESEWLTTTRAEYDYFKKKIWSDPTFIFGTDMAQRMHTWENNPDRFIETQLQKIFLQRPWYDFDFKGNDFDNYTLLDIPEMLGVSSTIAREMIQTKRSVSWILHPDITDDITQNDLYT